MVHEVIQGKFLSKSHRIADLTCVEANVLQRSM